MCSWLALSKALTDRQLPTPCPALTDFKAIGSDGSDALKFYPNTINQAGEKDLKGWVDMFVDMSRQTCPLSDAKGNEEQAKSETTHTKKEYAYYLAR